MDIFTSATEVTGEKKSRKPRHRDCPLGLKATKPIAFLTAEPPSGDFVEVDANVMDPVLAPLRPPLLPKTKGGAVLRVLPTWITNPSPISAHVAGACSTRTSQSLI